MLTTQESVETLDKLLEGATEKLTRPSSTAEEVQEALMAEERIKAKS